MADLKRRIGISPLTDRVYVGTIKETDPAEWTDKTDRTADFLNTVMEWCPPGYARDITRDDGRKYVVSCEEVTDDKEES